MFADEIQQLCLVANNDVDASGQQHGHQLSWILRAGVAGQVGLVEAGFIGITAHLANGVGRQVLYGLPVLDCRLVRGHKDGRAHADRPHQFILRPSLGCSSELEGHLRLAPIKHALDPLPGIQAQFITDLGFIQHGLHQFHIQALGLAVVRVEDKAVGGELRVPYDLPVLGPGRAGQDQEQSKAEIAHRADLRRGFWLLA